MEITEAKIKLVSDRSDKLKAYCTITIDHEFVIRDIKIIQGTRGYFVAMPSRKLMDRCPSCGGKNHLRAAYCNDCGGSLRPNRVSHDAEGRAKLHADIAHPINSACRERLQKRIIEAYEKELEASRRPGYVPPADDEVLVDAPGSYHGLASDARSPAGAPEPPEPSVPPPTGSESPPPQVEPERDADSFSGGIL